MRANRLAVGLDIGSSSVKATHLVEGRRGYSLDAFGIAPLPPEAIVDGAVMNSSAVVEAVRELFWQAKLKVRQVALGLQGHSVIVKKLQLPRMSQEELEESIQWEAEQYIPFDVKDVSLDVQVVREADEVTQQMDVVLVAAKKDMIDDYTAIISEAGLQTVVVDVDAFAVQNCFDVNYGFPPDQTLALVNAGASVVNVNVVRAGVTLFTRDISIGGNQFTEELQKQLHVGFDEAERLKMGGDSDDPDGIVPKAVEDVLSAVAEQVAGELQRSLDFFAASAADAPVSKVFLCGGTARVGPLFKVVESRLGIPVEIVNPFRTVDIDHRRFDPAYLVDIAPVAAVSVGLALRRAGDR